LNKLWLFKNPLFSNTFCCEKKKFLIKCWLLWWPLIWCFIFAMSFELPMVVNGLNRIMVIKLVNSGWCIWLMYYLSMFGVSQSYCTYLTPNQPITLCLIAFIELSQKIYIEDISWVVIKYGICWTSFLKLIKTNLGKFLSILVNQFNKFHIQWPRMLFSIFIINSNPTIISAISIWHRYIVRSTLFKNDVS